MGDHIGRPTRESTSDGVADDESIAGTTEDADSERVQYQQHLGRVGWLVGRIGLIPSGGYELGASREFARNTKPSSKNGRNEGVRCLSFAQRGHHGLHEVTFPSPDRRTASWEAESIYLQVCLLVLSFSFSLVHSTLSTLLG